MKPPLVTLTINGFEVGSSQGVLYDQDSHPEQCPRCGSDPDAWESWAVTYPDETKGAIGGKGCRECRLVWRVEYSHDAALIG